MKKPEHSDLLRYGSDEQAMMLLSCGRQLPPRATLKNPVCRRWQERCGNCPYAVKEVKGGG